MNGDVYQKQNGVWTRVGSIAGPRGVTWFQGSGAPPSGTGAEGDFYLLQGTSIGSPLAGDIGGSAIVPKIVGIQGQPVASFAPADSQVLQYDSGAGQWSPHIVSRTGTFANLPNSGMKAGDRYLCTDSPMQYIYTGSAWQAFWKGMAVTPPTLANFTWANQGGATATAVGGAVSLYDPAVGGGDNIRVLVKNRPHAPPWTFIVGMEYAYSPVQYVMGGATVYTASPFACGIFGAGYAGASQIKGVVTSTALTTWLGSSGPSVPFTFGSMLWVKMVDTGTNTLCYASTDGLTWCFLWGALATGYQQVGVFTHVENATNSFNATWFHYSES